jgi:hypothetical protein
MNMEYGQGNDMLAIVKYEGSRGRKDISKAALGRRYWLGRDAEHQIAVQVQKWYRMHWNRSIMVVSSGAPTTVPIEDGTAAHISCVILSQHWARNSDGKGDRRGVYICT